MASKRQSAFRMGAVKMGLAYLLRWQSDKVVIKFRKGKDKWASVASLLWN